MDDFEMDISGSSTDAGEDDLSTATETVSAQEIFSEQSEAEEITDEGSEAGSTEVSESENSFSANTEGSEEEQENTAAFDAPFTADSSDDLVSYIGVPAGYDVVAVANIPNYTNALIVLIFAIGSLLGFMFARIASWR